jgi:hypothetical protein
MRRAPVQPCSLACPSVRRPAALPAILLYLLSHTLSPPTDALWLHGPVPPAFFFAFYCCVASTEPALLCQGQGRWAKAIVLTITM